MRIVCRCGALCTATAAEDSVMLRIDLDMRREMQWHEPHTAYAMVLAVFRQADFHLVLSMLITAYDFLQ